MNEESLFVEAVEKPTASARKAFLDQACADNVELRRRMDQLLAAHQKTAGLLEHPRVPAGWADQTVSLAPIDRADDELAGVLVDGRYELLAEIGRGGMGTVWKAEQIQPVRRTVALKLIRKGMDSLSVVSRFEAERQTLALMEHPGIARVFDAGTTETGRPFFVMEYVEGLPLTRYCDDACLTVDDRLALFIQVCQAIQHAHTKGVIHRDLKPNNILVCHHDGQPIPKVIDFGLAKAIQQPLAERTLQTADGVVLGTPLYMSPEQAGFNNVDVDARSDIYALGVILYELLTGTTPLERKRLEEAAWDELVRLVREEEPPRPSARLHGSESLPILATHRGLDPARLTRKVRGELDWIAMRCLEKDRRRRYETAYELARDVKRYLADESVEACPPSTSYRLGKFIRRHKGPVVAATTSILLLTAGVVGTSWGLIRANSAREAEARLASREKSANAQAQKRLRQVENGYEILASVFANLDPDAEAKEGKPLRQILGERLTQAAELLEGDSLGDPLVVAKLQCRLGRSFRALGQATHAKSLYLKALPVIQKNRGPDDAETLRAMSEYGSVLYDLGDLAGARTLYEQVRDAQIRALGPDHRDALATQDSLALVYWRLGRPREACAILEQIRDTLIKNYGPDDEQTVTTLEDLSAVYDEVGRGAEAIKLAQSVRAAQLKRYGAEHPRAIGALQNLAVRYQNNMKMRQALALYEEARNAIVPKLGVEHPTSLRILDSLARSYRAFNRTTEAIALAEQVRDARVLLLGAYHPDTIYSMHNLGSAYQAAGQMDKAWAAFQQAAAGLERKQFVHAAGSYIVWSVCDYLEQHRRFDEADQWRQKWLAAVSKRDGADSIDYASELARQGENMLRNRRDVAAEPLLRASVAILQKGEPEGTTIAFAQSLLGDDLARQKRFAEAEPLLIQGYEQLKARSNQLEPLYARYRITEAGQRIVQLYEAWGRPEKADQWRKKVLAPPTHPPKSND